VSEPDSSQSNDGAESEEIQDLKAERVLLDRAIGGWRGLIDSALPTVVFLTTYVFNGNALPGALIAALVAGALVVAWRLIRRETLQQVFTGFIGLGIAAAFAQFTGRAENFFLPGLLTNLGYGLAFFISILVGWPLIGVVVGLLTGEGTSWRHDTALRRVYAAATWIWVGLFGMRLLVQVPLYLAGEIGILGTVKIVMGWPFFLACAYFTYRLLKPVLAARRDQERS
jgi:hypothetical protein